MPADICRHFAFSDSAFLDLLFYKKNTIMELIKNSEQAAVLCSKQSKKKKTENGNISDKMAGCLVVKK